MSDKFQDVFLIPVTWDEGEQPTAEKLESWATQTNTGFNSLESAIGDVWGVKEFTGDLGSSHNYLLCNHDGGNAASRFPNIVNLARLIGPASALNPMKQGRQQHTVTWDPRPGQPFGIPEGAYQFYLPYPPFAISDTYPAWTVAIDISSSAGHIANVLENNVDNGTNVFVNQQTSFGDVDSTGDYYIDKHGIVYTYDSTGDYSGIGSQNYYADMYWDAYDHASMNVIPDWTEPNQEGDPYMCVISENPDSTYNLELPVIRSLAKYDSDGNPYEPGDGYRWCPPADYQAEVPRVLQENLEEGNTIPDGFMQLWDNEATDTEWGGYIATGITFKYKNAHNVTIEGATLDDDPGNDRYRLITVGTTITESINELRWRMDSHNHTGAQNGQDVSHGNLTNLRMHPMYVDEVWGNPPITHFTVASPPSLTDAGVHHNHHPQYLCRYGWKQNIDPGQYDNAMLGDLFMGAVSTDYTTNSYDDNSVSSRKVYFSFTDNAIYYNCPSDPDRASLYLASTKDLFTLYSKSGTDCALNMGRPDQFGSPPYGTISWSSTKDRGFALSHYGSVGDAVLQTGRLYLHNTASVDSDPAYPSKTNYIYAYVSDTGYPSLSVHKSGKSGGFGIAASGYPTLTLYDGSDSWSIGPTATGLKIEGATNGKVFFQSDNISPTPANFLVDFTSTSVAIPLFATAQSVEGSIAIDPTLGDGRLYIYSDGHWRYVDLTEV